MWEIQIIIFGEFSNRGNSESFRFYVVKGKEMKG